MLTFAVGVLLEAAFAFGIYPILLVDIYLFIAALLVELLALGSMELVSSKAKKRAYRVFCAASTAFLAYALLAYGGTNIVQNYVTLGNPTLPVIIASSVITFPASLILITVAALSYGKTRNPKMLSIVTGVAVVVLAGTLYITSFPAFLYIAEFIGILLLWIGFYPKRKRSV